MAKKKKKRGKVIQMPLSPENYILNRARNLPIYECLITENWQEAGMANILIARKHTNGHITCGLYLIDILCLGIKDTFYQFNISESEYDQIKEEFNDKGSAITCDYVLAHNIIYGAVEFADDYGFSAHKDFIKVTQYILEEDNEKVELMDIEFGRNGKPCVVAEVGKEALNVVSQLEKTAGPGNYEIIYVDEEGAEIDEIKDDDLSDENFGEQLELFGDEFPKKESTEKNYLTDNSKDKQKRNKEDHNSTQKKEENMLPDKEETEVWRKLYELMIQINELQPWTWMYEYNIFAIKDPGTGKTGFVSIMGELGEHISVGVYMGEEGINGFWSLQEAGPNIKPEMFLEIPQLQASFEDRSMLHPKDMNIIKQLGMKFRGKQAWPMFRSFRPGYFPWFLEVWEKEFMLHILEQTIIMAKRFKKDPELLEKYSDDEFLIRIPDTETKIINWKDSVIRVPPEAPQEIQYKINAGDIEKLQNLPLSDLTFEVDLIMLPSAVEEKGIKPYFAYILMVVDKRSEMILGNEMMKPVPSLKEMWSTIPQHLVNALIRSGKRPKELHVQTELLAKLLEPITCDLGINLQLTDRLDVLEFAKKEILKYMDKR